MEKVDFKKQLRELYNPSQKQITSVDVPEMNFLMIDGEGNPNNSPQYREAVEALFTVSYTLKFSIKKSKGIDYTVMPLEGLWWGDDMASFSAENKNAWKWTSMIMQPKDVTAQEVKAAIVQAAKKKELPALSKLRFEAFHEGLSAQILYVGPFANEGPTIAKIHDYVASTGHTLSGKHHEIYLVTQIKQRQKS